jgi:hypothetical protein
MPLPPLKYSRLQSSLLSLRFAPLNTASLPSVASVSPIER